jgi:DNA-binding transcriptional ArsR family regulator
MSNYEKTEKLLNALASKTRLQILELIQEGTSNPGVMARRLNRHRSTIEKHLRVLLVAKIVEKVPSLSKGGQLTIQYKISAGAVELLSVVQDASEKF